MGGGHLGEFKGTDIWAKLLFQTIRRFFFFRVHIWANERWSFWRKIFPHIHQSGHIFCKEIGRSWTTIFLAFRSFLREFCKYCMCHYFFNYFCLFIQYFSLPLVQIPFRETYIAFFPSQITSSLGRIMKN